MKQQVRRGLTLSALNVFIRHYLSLSWLRGYIIDKKVSKMVYHNPEKDEEIQTICRSGDTDANEALECLLEDRKQMYFDLMFLVRIAHEWFPTVELFSEIMNHFDALEGNYTLIKRKRRFANPLTSIYFTVGSYHKIFTVQSDLSIYWKKVADITLEKQFLYDYYMEAKAEELKFIRGDTEDYLFDYRFQNDLQSKLIKTWLIADYQLCAVMEERKSRKDLIKYYEFLSHEAKNSGNLNLARNWEDVAWNEETNGHCPEAYLFQAWILQRISSKKFDALLSPVAVLWQKVYDVIEGEYSSDFYCKLGQLTFEFEKTLIEIHKLENEIIRFTIPNNSQFVCDVRDLFSEIPTCLRSHLLVILEHQRPFSYIDDNDLAITEQCLQDIKTCFTEFQSDWETQLSSLIQTVQIRDELVALFKDCPDLLGLVESKFSCYYDELMKHFMTQKGDIEQFIRPG
jgi:hypothetical protein